MDIKKIIQEEVNDFDWVKGVHEGTDMTSFFVVGELYDLGLVYGLESGYETEIPWTYAGHDPYWTSHDEYDDDRGTHKFYHGVDWDGENYTDSLSPKFIESQLMSGDLLLNDLRWDESINESNDFDWAKDISDNPLEMYFGSGYKWVNIVPKRMEDHPQIQQRLFDLGYEWNVGDEVKFEDEDIILAIIPGRNSIHHMMINDANETYNIDIRNNLPSDFVLQDDEDEDGVEIYIDNPFD